MMMHRRLVYLESKRKEPNEVLAVCHVRVGKKNETRIADLLSFNDVQTEGIDPMKWKEQSVTVRFSHNLKVETIPMRKVKAIGQSKFGRGKRKKIKRKFFSPKPNMRSRTQTVSHKRKKMEQTTIPWVLPTSQRKYGGAPVSRESDEGEMTDEEERREKEENEENNSYISI